jgi:hydroxybutyrate-dimer hydrolase
MALTKQTHVSFARPLMLAAALTTIAASLAACGSGSKQETINLKPSYLGTISSISYDGAGDDLLTGGLGKTGLGISPGPAAAIADQPTAAELRKMAIYNNYRAVLDISAAGGYGTLYGPNVDITGKVTQSEGKIAGTEYLAYSDDGTGSQNVTLMVQIPSSFDPANPCIVTGTSSGSRGVYGAIGSSGEWGLKHGCAVAYADKGSGNGIHDLQNNTVNLQNGVRATAAAAGKTSHFTANISDAERAAFNAATPNRFAVKHAHSQQNPEKDWGKWTLQSVEFALYALNEKYADLAQDKTRHLVRFKAGNTIVIASSISNGGGAALAAAEQDTTGLISGVAVSEPQVQMLPNSALSVKRGAFTLPGAGRSLLDYVTLANLLQPCAALAPDAKTAPLYANLVQTSAMARCNALKANGMIGGNSIDEMATQAEAALTAAGFQPESRDLNVAMYTLAIPAIAMTYTNALGRFSVKDNLCGYSFSGGTTLLPVSFGVANGIPPSAGISIFNNNSVGGAVADPVSISPVSGVKDYNADGAFCQRELAVGTSANAKRAQQGILEASRSGNLQGKPALIVHGRSDTLVPVGFASRPYYGVNQIVEGAKSKLSYIEVTNAQHFDAFLAVPGFNSRYVPLHVYFNQALDMMYANLKSGAALPPSQVVRTVPRAVDAANVLSPLGAANVPGIKLAPAAGDRIGFGNNVVTIPE